ncbi:MAG TPA: hypothetical protein VHD83_27425 [Puia sp.]|nr:hypothetical protein [Puia sp.]
MAKFTTRVELHGAYEESDYEILHQAMEKVGFIRTIMDTDTKIVYKLPPAEYNAIGNFTREQVLQAAKTAAKKTKKKFSVIVTPSTGRIWYNLEEEFERN